MAEARVIPSQASASTEEEGQPPFLLSLPALGGRLAGLGYWVREFFGENAYGRYVADWEGRHASDTPPAGEHRLMTEKEFFELQLRNKYGNHVQRCC